MVLHHGLVLVLRDQLQHRPVEEVSLREDGLHNLFVHYFYHLFAEELKIVADLTTGVIKHVDCITNSKHQLAEEADGEDGVVTDIHHVLLLLRVLDIHGN